MPLRPAAITFTLLALAIMSIGCETTHPTSHRPALINHGVYVKLKNPADADELIADCDRNLAHFPGIVSCYTGKRLDTGRPGIDRTFDVGFFAGFMSQDDYQRYLDSPQHQAALAKWSPRWESIRIDDVIDPTP